MGIKTKHFNFKQQSIKGDKGEDRYIKGNATDRNRQEHTAHQTHTNGQPEIDR